MDAAVSRSAASERSRSTVDRLRHRRIAGEAELGGDASLVDVRAVRERRLLAVERERPAGDRRVLERAAHHPGRRDGHAVVGERDRAGVGELAHLGQLLPALAAGDRREEADRDDRLALRAVSTSDAERRGRVDDGIGVRHREDRAEAAGRRGGGAARDRLLVLAPGRAQVDVRVDERRREDEPRRVDHAVLVRVDLLRDVDDRAVVDAHVEGRVDALGRDRGRARRG